MWWWDLVWHFVLTALIIAWILSLVFASRVETARQEWRRQHSER